MMFDFGVAIVGPGGAGSIIDNEEYYRVKGEWHKLSWFKIAEPGDRIVLHSGQSIVQGVGEIVEKDGSVYQYSSFFEDVDGWDLQHFCNVNWKKIELKLQ
ncbi:MAG: hypothetical protein KDC92_14225, partial [Bacteroidetes bacterium]|nr:hypothetical protein [Bacteroidota bacterium]